MRVSDGAKVGITVLVGLLALLGGMFWLRGSVQHAGSYEQRVSFTNAQGLQKGGYVRVRGVDFGEVEKVALGPDGNALVTLRLSDSYRVTANDSIRIVGGLLGFSAPYVEITPGGRKRAAGEPPAADGSASVPPNTVLSGALPGDSSANPEDLMADSGRLLRNLNHLSERMDHLTASFARIADDPKLRQSLTRTATNFEKISDSGVVIAKNMQGATGRAETLIASFQSTAGSLDRTLKRADGLIASLNSTAGETRGLMQDARGVVKNTGDLVQNTNATVQNAGGLVTDARSALTENRQKLHDVLTSLDSSLKKLDGTLTEAKSFISDPTLRGNLSETSKNLREATATLSKVANDVHGLTGDPKVQEDLRATLSNLREVSAEAGETLRRVSGVLGGGGKAAKSIGQRVSEAELDAALLRTTNSNRTRLDFSATIPWSETSFYRLGFYDFGEHNRLSAQMGQKLPFPAWGRFGIYASSLGAGIDFGNRQHPPLSLDLFGVDRPQLDVRSNIPVSRNFDLTLGLDNALRNADPIFGIRYRK